MNTKLTSLSLVALLGAAGGAYVYMNPDKTSELMDSANLTQYVPESVAGFMGLSTPVDESVDVTDDTHTPNFEDTQEAQDEASSDNIFVDAVEAVSEQTTEMAEEAQTVVEAVANQAKESTQNTDQANVSSSENHSENMGELSDDPDSAEIQKQIAAVNREIARLDEENKQLSNRFSDILKKNRTLAKQLKELDEKIAAFN